MGEANGRFTGLLVDWGGVMTTNLFASFAAFCEAESLDPQRLRDLFRDDKEARDLLIEFECGRVEESIFQDRLCAALGVDAARAETLIDRLFERAQADMAMVDAVRAARRAGIKTGLVSNSWGTRRYPRPLLTELFDGVVISGEEGMRKPTTEMYSLGAQRIGVPPERCVFVDDLPFNLEPARELGMAVVHHTEAATTVAELERLLGVSLRGD
jgi:epoxide hydrolase-like predicted phosphatase